VEELKNLVHRILFGSSSIIRSEFSSTQEVFYKDKSECFTKTDIHVSEYLTRELLKAGFRSDQIITEEAKGSGAVPEDGYWLIDPLDGTKEFIKSIPEFSVSISYIKNREITLGAVCNPLTGFSLVRVNEPKFRVSSSTLIQDGLLLSSRTETEKGKLNRLIENHERFVFKPVGSIAYKLALVAAGKALGALSLDGKNAWDIAAGVYLVENAGGTVTDLTGGKLLFNHPHQRFEKGILATFSGVDHFKILGSLENR
jgi:myo-inositol-1(or 4)-monophosphatase